MSRDALQATASKTELITGVVDPKTGLSRGGCARPFGAGVRLEFETESEEKRAYGRKYGSALHELLWLGLGGKLDEKTAGDTAVKWGLDFDASAELLPHALRAVASLQRWMAGANPWKETFRIVGAEKHLATRVRVSQGAIDVRTRETDFDDEEHHYDLASYEIGGTYDLLLESYEGQLTVVLDYKTGSGDSEDYSRPALLPQMRTLAVMTSANGVAILHTPRAPGETVLYSESISSDVLESHARALRIAQRRFGDGSMRPGEHCRYCPARVSCPAKDGELLLNAGALVKDVVSERSLAKIVDGGAGHYFVKELFRLGDRYLDELKQKVKEGVIYQRPNDGKFLVIRPGSRENLSKASIIRALGKVKGEKLIERLRKQGCVETTEFESLVAENGK